MPHRSRSSALGPKARSGLPPKGPSFAAPLVSALTRRCGPWGFPAELPCCNPGQGGKATRSNRIVRMAGASIPYHAGAYVVEQARALCPRKASCHTGTSWAVSIRLAVCGTAGMQVGGLHLLTASSPLSTTHPRYVPVLSMLGYGSFDPLARTRWPLCNPTRAPPLSLCALSPFPSAQSLHPAPVPPSCPALYTGHSKRKPCCRCRTELGPYGTLRHPPDGVVVACLVVLPRGAGIARQVRQLPLGVLLGPHVRHVPRRFDKQLWEEVEETSPVVNLR